MLSEPPGRRASERDSSEARSGRPGGTLDLIFDHLSWAVSALIEFADNADLTVGNRDSKVERVPRGIGPRMRFGLMVCGCSLRTQQGA